MARVRVPNLGGLTMSAARSKLAAVGLHASAVQVVSSRAQRTVVDQSPEAGTEVRKGETVRLTVSSAPAKVTVPSVVGLDEQSAQDELQAEGFQVRVVNESTTRSVAGRDGVRAGSARQHGGEARLDRDDHGRSAQLNQILPLNVSQAFGSPV